LLRRGRFYFALTELDGKKSCCCSDDLDSGDFYIKIKHPIVLTKAQKNSILFIVLLDLCVEADKSSFKAEIG